MNNPALIRNPRSHRNRRTENGEHAFAREWLGERFVEPGSAADMETVLRDLAAREVDWIIVDGGDGTVRDVLTALPDAFPERLPRLSIVPSGNTNVIASDVGLRVRGPAALAALRDAAAAGGGQVSRRSCIEVHREANIPVLRGMFFGVGVYRQTLELAHRSVYHGHIGHGAGVAAAIAACCYQILAGAPESPWRAGERMEVAVDGGEPINGHHFLVLATTLHRLVLGIWPFWNEASGPIRFLDIEAPPKRLPRVLWSVLRGRSPAWLRNSGTYRSFGVEEIHVQLDEGFVLDGESYVTGPAGLRIGAGPAVDYFRP